MIATKKLTEPDHSDVGLRDAVLSELIWTSSIDGASIGVEVHQGAVTLSGDVGTYPERLQAEAAALRVHGVVSVAEAITVRHRWEGGPSDAEIALEASKALALAIDVPDGTVQAVVHNNCITLTGSVVWHHELEAAERAVRYLRGVTGIYDKIRVEPTLTPTASSLTAAITAAFVRSAELEADNIEATATGDGHVVLEGIVHSPAERRRAERATWSAPGVTQVLNHLQVVV